jgi:hypothetical protein
VHLGSRGITTRHVRATTSGRAQSTADTQRTFNEIIIIIFENLDNMTQSNTAFCVLSFYFSTANHFDFPITALSERMARAVVRTNIGRNIMLLGLFGALASFSIHDMLPDQCEAST